MPGLVTGLDFVPLVRGGYYRHMAKRDVEVWERFIERQRLAWLGVAYDVALGGVPAVPMAAELAAARPGASALDEAAAANAEAERALTEGWQYSTAIKVDAVLMGADRLMLVEVRPWAHAGTLGNALCYTLVAQRERISDLPLAPMIVCEGIQRDIRWVASQLGVQVVEV